MSVHQGRLLKKLQYQPCGTTIAVMGVGAKCFLIGVIKRMYGVGLGRCMQD